MVKAYRLFWCYYIKIKADLIAVATILQRNMINIINL